MSRRSLQKPLLGVALVTCLLLLVPAVAMHYTTEVSWGLSDFAAAAALVFAAGTLIVLGVRRFSTTIHCVSVVVLVALAFLLAWAELAVGLFH